MKYQKNMKKQPQENIGLLGYNIVDGEKRELTTIEDDDGKDVLRVVKAAEVAYESEFIPGIDSFRVASQSRVKIDTVLENVQIEPNTSIAGNFNFEGATEVWFIIQMDKAPWAVSASQGPWANAQNLSPSTLYPMRRDVPTTHVSVPLRSLFCMVNEKGATTEYIDFDTAYNNRNIMNGRVSIRNDNETETANATIKIMKVWRG